MSKITRAWIAMFAFIAVGQAHAAVLSADATKASCWKGSSTLVISDYKATVNGRKVGPGQIRTVVGKTLLTYSTPRSSMYLQVRNGDLQPKENSSLCKAKKHCVAFTEKASAGNDQIYQCLFFR